MTTPTLQAVGAVPTAVRGRYLSKRTARALAFVLATLVWAAPGRAEDEAVARFERGVQLYEAENYEGALVEFLTAYKLTNNYKLLYNIGICQNAMKDYAAAAESFTKYLADGGSELSEARRADVEERLAKLALMITKVRVATDAPAGSVLLVDGRPAATIPLPGPLAVKIGRRQFSISASGRTVTKTVDVTSGDTHAEVHLMFSELVPSPPPSSAPVAERPPPAPGADSPSFPWPLWTLTVLLGGGAAVTGMFAVEARNDLEEKQATFGISREALEEDRDRARMFGVATDALIAGAVLSAGLSTYFTLRWASKKSAATSPPPVAGVSVLPAGIGYMRSF
jgi:hypothetical protein